MAYEVRDNSGSLFKNDRREKETQPNARGDAMIDGVMYEISSWTKEGRNGKFQSLSFKRKEARQEERTHRADEPRSRAPERNQRVPERDSYGNFHEDLNDDVPF